MSTANNSRINVLLVEDSPTAQLLLTRILQTEPRLHVVGAVGSGEEALKFLQHKKPDIILMDIHMRGMDGFATTRKIMETTPIPIVVCTGSFDPNEVATQLRAMEAGAVAIVAKPVGPESPEYAALAAKLVETVTLMSEIKVIKRWPRRTQGEQRLVVPVQLSRDLAVNSCSLVAIGISTGGPPVLKTILAELPREFPLPLLIVQHIAAGFLPGLVEWLNECTGFPVRIATHREAPLPGHAYLAPDDYHMAINDKKQIVLSSKPPENGLRPSVSHLFRSVCEVCGSKAVGILLTGMGKDGALELKQLKDAGAITIAQDKESSVVHGMPGEAIRINAARHILAPEQIAALLAGLSTSDHPAPEHEQHL